MNTIHVLCISQKTAHVSLYSSQIIDPKQEFKKAMRIV